MDIEYQEVLYNDCYGGFSFSEEFETEYNKRHGEDDEAHAHRRTNSNILSLFKEMGKKANSQYSHIRITQIPKELMKYMNIHEYDGVESVTINFEEALSDLMKETYKNNFLTDEIKKKYERIQLLKKAYHDINKDNDDHDNSKD